MGEIITFLLIWVCVELDETHLFAFKFSEQVQITFNWLLQLRITKGKYAFGECCATWGSMSQHEALSIDIPSRNYAVTRLRGNRIEYMAIRYCWPERKRFEGRSASGLRSQSWSIWGNRRLRKLEDIEPSSTFSVMRAAGNTRNINGGRLGD